jgi:hypothetical protein
MTTTSTTAADLWHRISATAPAPGLGLVLATLTVALAGTALPEVWRWTRHVVTVAHEGAHGVAAVLSGRRLAGIRLHSDSSGLTVSAGRSTGVGMVLTAAAGYVGPGLAGLGVAAVVSRGHALAALWLLLVLLAWMLLQIRSLFGLWYVAAAGGAVFAVTWWASGHVQTLVAYTVTWFLLLGAPRAVVELHRSRRGRRDRTSDAATLARLTGLPGLLWVGFFLAVTLGCLLLGGRLLVGAVR